MDILYLEALNTLGDHLGAAVWALLVFLVGLLLASPVVRLEVTSLLAFPRWFMKMARTYLGPTTSPLLLGLCIFGFNTVAIFVYMISGGLVVLPIVFCLFTGLNVGAALLMEAQASLGPPEAPEPPVEPTPPKPWVGLCGLFVIVVELSAFWLAIGMGLKLGHLMRQEFTWATFRAAAEPRVTAYLLVLAPALLISAIAETAAIKGALGKPEPGEG
jgi:hypothetical protein